MEKCSVWQWHEGSRRNRRQISCTEPTILTATLHPEQPFFKNVTWKDRESGKIISLASTGNFAQDCKVTVNYDVTGKESPAWIQNIINEDNNKKAADRYLKLTGAGTYVETIMATSEDQTHGNVTASCDVTINFVTTDETIIHPETVTMSKDKVQYDLVVTKTGDIKSADASVAGFDPIDLDCIVIPDVADDDAHKPYDRSVTWSVSDSDALAIDQNGVITPNRNAQWVKDAMLKPPYKATKAVSVYATTNDNQKTGTTEVTLTYTAKCIELKEDAITYDLTLKKTGSRSNPTLTWGGADAKNMTAVTFPEAKGVKYTASAAIVLHVDENGTITPVLDAMSEWMKPAMARPYTATTTVMVQGTDGTSTDTCMVTINLKVTDSTSSGSGGGSGGGGGGGSSSTGVTPGGGPISSTAKLPDYVVSGTWIQNASGKWMFTDNTRTYANEWAAVHNPYANVAAGQSSFDWFRFDQEGFLVTGWYTDVDGDSYYLNAVSDGTLGRMVTGWNVIDGKNYYFNETSNGHRGALLKNTTTPDGYPVDGNGVWIH